MYGYAGKILKVDLTKESFNRPVDMNIAQMFLGGGLAAKLMELKTSIGTSNRSIRESSNFYSWSL
jgi:aldehyde:ferredoxin oxidoreductase